MYYGCFEDRSNGMTTPGSFAIRGRTLLPTVQGGMRVGVSVHQLAGAGLALTRVKRKREAATA